MLNCDAGWIGVGATVRSMAESNSLGEIELLHAIGTSFSVGAQGLEHAPELHRPMPSPQGIPSGRGSGSGQAFSMHCGFPRHSSSGKKALHCSSLLQPTQRPWPSQTKMSFWPQGVFVGSKPAPTHVPDMGSHIPSVVQSLPSWQPDSTQLTPASGAPPVPGAPAFPPNPPVFPAVSPQPTNTRMAKRGQ